MFYDPLYLLLVLLPSLVIGALVQSYVKNAYKTNIKKGINSRLTGAEVAGTILKLKNIHNVSVNMVPGKLTDNYNPLKKSLNLSSNVYRGVSIASAGIAAHECGHAIQHAGVYTPLLVRNAIVPVANIGGFLVWPLVILGFIAQLPFLIDIGIVLFLGIIAFHLITLPVEFNASRRAVNILKRTNILTVNELSGARQVLNAAALTYVANTLVAFLNLVYLLMLRGRR